MLILRNRLVVAAALMAVVATVMVQEWALVWLWLTLLFVVVAAFEWAKLSGFSRADSVLFALLFLLFAVPGGFLLEDNLPAQRFFIGTVVCFWALVAPWWLLQGWSLPRPLMGAAGMLLLFAAWLAARTLFVQDWDLLVLGIVVVCLFDTVAYCVGRLLGKTPLAPAISPNKTVEGLVGGVTAVLLLGLAHRYFFPQGHSTAVLLSILFSMSALALVGDLFESGLKRRLGVKDSGSWLGNHGGVLDRFDAMLPVLPFVFLVSSWLV